jgi:uncharacterized membrane protein
MCSLPLKILIVLTCCALLWFGYTGLKNDQVYVKGGRWVRREDSPFNYWLSVTMYFLAGLGGLAFAFFSR